MPFTLKTVYRKTFDARSKWQNILLELNFDSDLIRTIGVRYKYNPDDCYREGLEQWLRSGERSWKELAEALASPTVGHEHIAKEIENKYLLDRGSGESQVEEQIMIRDNHMTIDRQQVINDDLVLYTDKNLGAGAFGFVFKGSYKEKLCAIKVLHHAAMNFRAGLYSSRGREGALKAFEQECDLLQSFTHPNVVQHLTTKKHPQSGDIMLVTELMDCSLNKFLAEFEEPLSRKLQISLSRDIASGMAYIHSKDIIHRDLCGENVLLTRTQPIPVAKISDFGMSRLNPCRHSSTLTAMGHRQGYLAPEATRMSGEHYDQSMDVFSFGVIMVQIACNLETVKNANHRSAHFTNIPETHPLKELIEKCLQNHMERRLSMESAYNELDWKWVSEDGNATDYHAQTKSNSPQNVDPWLLSNWKRRNIAEEIQVMHRSAQCVACGDSVYVGGDSEKSGAIIWKLNLVDDKWSQLPEYGTKQFAMVVFLGKLLLVGGKLLEGNHDATDKIAVLESEEWTYPYPGMSTARYSSTAASYANFVIVAGGLNNEAKSTSSVECFDLASSSWYYVQSLPNPRVDSKASVIGSTLYLVGGKRYDDVATKTVDKVEIPELLGSNALRPLTIWQAIRDMPLTDSAPVCFKNSLLAIGGASESYDENEDEAAIDSSKSPSSSISVYKPVLNAWVLVKSLNERDYFSTLSVLPDGGVIELYGLN